LKFRFIENLCIPIPDVKNRAIEWFDDLLLVPVIGGPLVIVNFEVEHIALQQICHIDSSEDEHRKILLEQVAADEVVLELDDVVDQVIHCSNLVVLQSIVYRCGVVETHSIFFGDFVFENDRVPVLKVLAVLLIKQ
jgi:hypothetical protein